MASEASASTIQERNIALREDLERLRRLYSRVPSSALEKVIRFREGQLKNLWFTNISAFEVPDLASFEGEILLGFIEIESS